MKRINLTQYAECFDKTCEFQNTCAQHYTAGDFRVEDGLRPVLVNYSEDDGVPSVACASYSNGEPNEDSYMTSSGFGFVPWAVLKQNTKPSTEGQRKIYAASFEAWGDEWEVNSNGRYSYTAISDNLGKLIEHMWGTFSDSEHVTYDPNHYLVGKVMYTEGEQTSKVLGVFKRGEQVVCVIVDNPDFDVVL